jgi:hypothetical protein
MMDGRTRTIETLFTLATHLPRDLWDVLLEQATSDPALRTAVRERLAARDAPADMPTGAAEPMPASGGVRWEERLQDAFRVGWIGRHIGSYEITGLLGQGGMGTVYRARRADASSSTRSPSRWCATTSSHRPRSSGCAASGRSSRG